MVPTLIAATAHHGLVFVVIALLAAELVLLRPGLDAGTLRLLGRIDLLYGACFGILAVIGLARITWFEKGWDYYLESSFFQLKMAALIGIGLLSVLPTLRIIRWRSAGRIPHQSEIAATRRLLWAEAALMPVVGFAAAAMARGF